MKNLDLKQAGITLAVVVVALFVYDKWIAPMADKVVD